MSKSSRPLSWPIRSGRRSTAAPGTKSPRLKRKPRHECKEQYFHSTDSRLSAFAKTIVQYVAEIKKPDGERLPGYHDAQLDSLRFDMFSPAPVYRDMEIARITGALELDLQQMGPPIRSSRSCLAARALRSRDGAGERHETRRSRGSKQLMEGGEAAVAASTDRMIVLARKLDPMRREFVKWMEDNVESVDQRAGRSSGQSALRSLWQSAYPDATFTLRLSYGQVKGYPMNGTIAPPKTTFYGLYDRAGSFDLQGPFWLPSRVTWRAGAKSIFRRRSIS